MHEDKQPKGPPARPTAFHLLSEEAPKLPSGPCSPQFAEGSPNQLPLIKSGASSVQTQAMEAIKFATQQQLKAAEESSSDHYSLDYEQQSATEEEAKQDGLSKALASLSSSAHGPGSLPSPGLPCARSSKLSSALEQRQATQVRLSDRHG